MRSSHAFRPPWPTTLLLAGLCAACRSATSEAPAHAAAAVPSCPQFARASAGLPDTGEWRTLPSIGDVNGDGLGDLAGLPRKGGGPSVFRGDGLGSWTEISNGLSYGKGFSCGIGTRLVDIDGDGNTDLIAADHCKGVRIYRGDGGSSWNDASKGIPTNLAGFNDADIADIDGDGALEVVAVSAFSHGFLVLRYRRGEGWSVVENTGLPVVGFGHEIELVDATGDGRLDVVSSFSPVSEDRRDDPPPPAKLWVQQADGTFAPARTFPEEGRFFGVATLPRRGAAARDLYFGLTGARAGLYAFEPNESGEWIERGPIDAGWWEGPRPGFLALEAADMNGDGCDDLVLGGGRPMRVWIALGDCEGGLSLCPEPTVPMDKRPASIWGVTTGDLNGDGRLDVAAGLGSAGRGGLMAWIQQGPR